MSIESNVGRTTREVTLGISDAVCSNLVSLLKNEMSLNNDQINKIFAVVKSTVESTGMNAVNQYVALFNEIQNESTSASSKKSRLFG